MEPTRIRALRARILPGLILCCLAAARVDAQSVYKRAVDKARDVAGKESAQTHAGEKDAAEVKKHGGAAGGGGYSGGAASGTDEQQIMAAHQALTDAFNQRD